jgi:hypothetical protein
LLGDARQPDLRQPRRSLVIAPLVELDGERFTIDERHVHKRPDWTYEPG